MQNFKQIVLSTNVNFRDEKFLYIFPLPSEPYPQRKPLRAAIL